MWAPAMHSARISTRRVCGSAPSAPTGRYDYDGALFDGSDYVATNFDGQDSFAAALIGYQFRPGAVTIKLFGGIEAEDQQVVPHDPNNAVQGTEIGFRVLVKTWYDISPRWFLSADASYGTAFQEYCSLARVGFRVRPKLSLGLEGRALGNEEYSAGRSGGFVRLNLRRLEVTLSSGFTGELSRRQPERLSLARSLPNILEKERAHQSALPAPPRQCLGSSALSSTM